MDVMDVIEQRIVRAATCLLQQVGDGFTMDQLASKAKVPRATLYRRVGSKEALMQRLAGEQGIAFDPQRNVMTRILQGARRVFGHYGLTNATIEQIADEAGVGVATVYRHFGDKDHLVWAVVEELSPRPFVRDLISPTEDVAADLMALTTTLLPFFHEYRDILRIILTGSPAERAYVEHLRTGSERTLDQIAAYFAAQLNAGRLRAAGQPQELALAYIGLLFTFAVIGPTHYGTSLDDPEHASHLIVQIFLKGLNQPSPQKEAS
ncbi:MAG: TetR/AcrR family transcriptional regulator [Chloroflexi bacterium]|nr:TetR/AcrR family transcriptional regulator [Chloroflexota bacterium]